MATYWLCPIDNTFVGSISWPEGIQTSTGFLEKFVLTMMEKSDSSNLFEMVQNVEDFFRVSYINLADRSKQQ